jgi:hypothetical protein
MAGLWGLLVGLAGGIGATCVGIYYGEWLRDRRAHQKHGAQLIARVRGLLEDADPGAFSLGSMRERNQRHGKLLWRRWRELREPFREYGLLDSPEVRGLTERVATDVALTIQALRDSVDDAFDSGRRAARRRTAEKWRGDARETLDRLEQVVDRSGWRRRSAATRP